MEKDKAVSIEKAVATILFIESVVIACVVGYLQQDAATNQLLFYIAASFWGAVMLNLFLYFGFKLWISPLVKEDIDSSLLNDERRPWEDY